MPDAISSLVNPDFDLDMNRIILLYSALFTKSESNILSNSSEKAASRL